MSRMMAVRSRVDADFDEPGASSLFDVKRAERELAPITYMHPRTLEYVSSGTMAAAALAMAYAVDDGGLEPVFED